jgi:hypothetical protein
MTITVAAGTSYDRAAGSGAPQRHCTACRCSVAPSPCRHRRRVIPPDHLKAIRRRS